MLIGLPGAWGVGLGAGNASIIIWGSCKPALKLASGDLSDDFLIKQASNATTVMMITTRTTKAAARISGLLIRDSKAIILFLGVYFSMLLTRRNGRYVKKEEIGQEKYQNQLN